MKALLLMAFLTATLVGGTSVQTQQPELRLTLRLEKAQFTSEEPVVARISLENLTSSDVVINSRLLVNRPVGPHELFFHLIGPDRKVVRFDARIRASFESRDFITLKGKQVLNKDFDLTRVYTFEAPGEYTATLFYENKQDPPSELKLAPAWKGRLKSNSVKFSIK